MNDNETKDNGIGKLLKSRVHFATSLVILLLGLIWWFSEFSWEPTIVVVGALSAIAIDFFLPSPEHDLNSWDTYKWPALMLVIVLPLAGYAIRQSPVSSQTNTASSIPPPMSLSFPTKEGKRFYTVAFTPDGRSLLSRTIQPELNEDSFRLTDVESGKPEKVPFDVNGKRSSEVAVSPDSTMFAFTNNDNTVFLWNRTNGSSKAFQHGDAQEGNVHSVAFSPDGKMLMTGGAKHAKMWSVTDPSKPKKIFNTDNVVLALSISPDGRVAATLDEHLTIQLWSVDTGEPTKSFSVLPDSR